MNTEAEPTTEVEPTKPKKKRLRRTDGEGLITTQSLWQTFQRCEKRAEWQYIHRLRPKKIPEPLEFGTLFHQCMEIWYGRHQLPEAFRAPEMIFGIIQKTIDDYYPRWSEAVEPETGIIKKDDAESFRHLRSRLLMTAMIHAYIRKYPEEPWRILAIEKEFRVPIRNPETNKSSPYDLVGKIDLLVFDKETEELVIVDHKTAKTIDSNYILGLELDLQVHLYAIHAAKYLKIKHPIKSVKYNVVKKCQLQGRSGETAEELQDRMHEWYMDDESFFRHEGIPMDEEKCLRFERELWERSRYWYRKTQGQEEFLRNTTACFNPMAKCPYVELCKTGTTMDEVQLVVQDQFIVADEAHPELTDEMLDPDLVTK